jgi:hypothetical protein
MDLTTDEMEETLSRFIEQLVAKGIKGTVKIYGGAAVIYHLPELRTTTDIDSIFAPLREIQEQTEIFARSNPGLGARWFNAQIHDVMPLREDENPKIFYNANGLKVTFASVKYLLAMKAMSDRRSVKDLDDAAKLFNALQLSTWLDIDKLVTKYYSTDPGSQELFFEDIEERAEELQNSTGTAEPPVTQYFDPFSPTEMK